jgi:hypothetical protein
MAVGGASSAVQRGCVGEVVLAFSLIVAALAVRVHAASFQLWLDEIWALEASRSVGSLADLFRAEVLDGHFSLYTVWLGAFTAATPEEVLRLPSLVGGAVQLIGTWFLARRWWGCSAAMWVTVFGAISFFFLVYATEARSYAVVGGCAVVAVLLADRYDRAPTLASAGLFGAVVVCGALFHLTFVPFYIVFALSDAVVAFSKYGLGRGFGRALRLHLAPASGVGMLLVTVAGALGPGTGPIVEYVDTLVDTLALVAGGPLVSPSSSEQTMCALVVASIVLAGIVRAMLVLARQRDPRGLLLGALVFGVPLVTVALEPRIFLPRYLYIAVWASHLVLARLVSLTVTRGQWRSREGVVAFLFAGLVVGANFRFSANFVAVGRGDLQGAIGAACALGSSDRVRIGGTHQFRDQMMIDYFAREMCGGRGVTYESTDAGVKVDALLVQSQDTAFSPLPAIARSGTRYEFVRAFPYAGLSGWGWYLYRPVE